MVRDERLGSFGSSKRTVRWRGEERIKEFILKYYKNLFGPSQSSGLTLDESMVEDIPLITGSEGESLMAEFSEKEVREAIFQIKHNKASGPDGFLTEFYQVFWILIKDNLMAMFRDFHKGNLPLCCLNFGIITLIPKEMEVKRFQQYRRICMLNVSFKIFKKCWLTDSRR
jgi:hypothetical protein